MAKRRTCRLQRILTGLSAGTALGVILVLPIACLAAEVGYRLQPGEVIGISVAGVTSLPDRVPIQLDGTINFPLVGTVNAGGSTLSEIRRRLQTSLASRIIRSRSPEGRETVRTIEADDVAVNILEYRPVTVTGDVVRPGEQAFRPGMTARQAVASSGGVLTTPLRDLALTDAAGLRAEYTTAWLNAAREQARAWRIRRELGEEVQFDRSALPLPPVSAEMLTDILRLEEQSLQARQDHNARVREGWVLAIRHADEELTTLYERLKQEQEGYQADIQDLDKAKRAYSQGDLPSPKVADARRSVLLSTTRLLETNAQRLQVNRIKGEFERELEKVDSQRRIELLADLQDANVKRASELARLQSLDEKLRMAGSRPPRSSDSAALDVSIYRTKQDASGKFEGNQDSELQPGDIVEVALRSEHISVAGQ